MDVVSEVLGAVKLEGAFYFNGEFSAPWGVRSPPSSTLAPYLGGRGRHVIIFHLLTEGQGAAGLERSPLLPLVGGDIVVFPHGDAHIVSSGSAAKAVDYEGELHRVLAQGLRVTRSGGGGDVTRFVCGYLTCDRELSRVFLAGLPPVFKVNVREEGTGQWLENAIRFSVGDSGAAPAGGEAVLARLAEALFIETLRRYITALPADQTGWLAGARDPEVGKALALMHAKPAQPWTIAELAREAGVSRSVLAERFRHFLGEPPMTYLTRWRLQLGARLLQTTNRSVADIGAEAGYESEPAFNRAFRREFGTPPAKFRNASRKSL
ncbi:MAG: AraC family transcriptional regulator [Bryobacteraceae bacterium]